MSKTIYQPEKGTEQYIHAEVTHKQGQELKTPVVEQYYPALYEQISKLAGFKATIVHDPRTATQKRTEAPAVDVVKTTEPLETEDQLRARYKELFNEEAAVGTDLDGLKRLVEGAERKLAEPQSGEATVEETEGATDAPAAPARTRRAGN